MKKVVISALAVVVALMSSCSTTPQGVISEGSASKFDSLSYALGANIGFDITNQMSDVPLDFKAITDGFSDQALAKKSIDSDESLQILQEYFMQTRSERAQIVAEKLDAADAEKLANGVDEATIAAQRAALKADADMFESEEQRQQVSYSLGVDLANNIMQSEIPVHAYWLNTAMIEAGSGNSQMSSAEAMEYLQTYFTVTRPAEMQAVSAENLAKIEKESGVIKTESGLMYRVEVAGDNDVIATDDRDVVKVHYTGRLIRTDKVFDTSRFADRTEEQQAMMLAQNPAAADEDSSIEFPLNRVIPGWTEGMKFVGKGGRISLWIPSELAYGERGAGRDIGPNEALYFDVEILDVIPFVEGSEEE